MIKGKAKRAVSSTSSLFRGASIVCPEIVHLGLPYIDLICVGIIVAGVAINSLNEVELKRSSLCAF